MRVSPAARNDAPPIRRARRLSQDERREQLLGCALKAFPEHGLVATNHALVAAEANVSAPAVFHYCSTRVAQIDAVLAEVESFYRAALASGNGSSLCRGRNADGNH